MPTILLYYPPAHVHLPHSASPTRSAAVNLQIADYTFCWRSGKMKHTPAEGVGLTGYYWTFDKLLGGWAASYAFHDPRFTVADGGGRV